MQEETYVGEENSGDTATCVDFLLMAFSTVIATHQTSTVARNRELVSFDTAIGLMSETANSNEMVAWIFLLIRLLPAQRKVGCGNHLDKVHEIVGGVGCYLFSII